MSMTVAAVLLVNFMFFVVPQTPVASETPTDIAVLKASWEKQSFRPGWDAAQDPVSNGPRDPAATNVPPPETVLNANGTQGPPPSTARGPERREPRKNRHDPRETDSLNVGSGPTDRVNRYHYQIKVLNSSTKTIAAIDWEYQFASGDLEPSRHRFQTFQRIKPDGSSTLTGESPVPPTRVVNASDTSQVTSRVVVHCVLYSDGSVSWREARPEADCQSLRARRASR